MLKLQRESHDDITIRLRDSGPLFSRNLLWGIFLACAIHLIGYGVIDIKKMKNQPFISRAPTNVEASMGSDAESSGTITSLQIDQQGLLPRYILEPESSIPQLPQLPKVVLTSRSKSERVEGGKIEEFQQLEQVKYRTEIEQLPLQRAANPIQVRVSGSLASRIPDTTQLHALSKRVLKEMQPGQYSVKMDVRVDDKTGEIFWAQIKESSKQKLLDNAAYEMVRAIRFNRNTNAFVTGGVIEVLFTSFDHSLEVAAMRKIEGKK